MKKSSIHNWILAVLALTFCGAILNSIRANADSVVRADLNARAVSSVARDTNLAAIEAPTTQSLKNQHWWDSIIDVGRNPIIQHFFFDDSTVKNLLTDPPPNQTVTHSGHIETIGIPGNQITVLYLQGTPYEMGFQHGKLTRPQVWQTVEGVNRGMAWILTHDTPSLHNLPYSTKESLVNAVLDKAWAKMEPFVPQDKMEELAGLAAGSGVPLKTLLRMHAVPDLSETSCSGLVAPPSVTSDGHTYQLRLLDYEDTLGIQERPSIIIYRPQQGNAYANIGWIGFVGVVSGMNDKGVAVSEKGLGDPKGETLSGIPMPFLLEQVLRYANTAEEGTALIRAARRTNSYLYLIGDPKGGAVGMITSAQNFYSWKPNQVKHIPRPDRDYFQIPNLIFASHYHETMGKSLEGMRGKIDEQTLQVLSRQVAMPSNIHAVIYRLDEGRIWVSNRVGSTRAADRPYVTFSLKDAWKKYLDR